MFELLANDLEDLWSRGMKSSRGPHVIMWSRWPHVIMWSRAAQGGLMRSCGAGRPQVASCDQMEQGGPRLLHVIKWIKWSKAAPGGLMWSSGAGQPQVASCDQVEQRGLCRPHANDSECCNSSLASAIMAMASLPGDMRSSPLRKHDQRLTLGSFTDSKPKSILKVNEWYSWCVQGHQTFNIQLNKTLGR